MAEAIGSIKVTPSRDEILKRAHTIFKRVSSGRVVGADRLKALELRRIDAIYQMINDKLTVIVDTHEKTEGLHQFYKELLAITVDYDRYREALQEIIKARRIITTLWRKYRRILKACEDPKEMKRIRREAIGRMLSVIRRKGKHINLLHEASRVIRRFPGVDPTLKTILIAGMPQVGKSTLVKRISTAKPEIAPYPFTTKQIIVGHLDLDEHTRIQVVDTPGLLDRPLSERNPIELQAILALKHLSDVVVYLFDVSTSSYYPLEQQLNVLDEILEKFRPRLVIPVVSKIDITEEEAVEAVERALERRGFHEVLRISPVKNVGIDLLVRRVREALRLPPNT